MSRGQRARTPQNFPRMKHRAFARREDARTNRLLRQAFIQLAAHMEEKHPADVDAMWEEFKQRVGWDEPGDDEEVDR